LQVTNSIRHGPYRFVRHPIYVAMLVFLIVFELDGGIGWLGASGVSILFVVGTWLRASAEDRLLRARFNAEFDVYASEVPAFVPSLRAFRGRRNDN
jgi:protein-S-isoprenylcysteine O-methyltransferase Ste14